MQAVLAILLIAACSIVGLWDVYSVSIGRPDVTVSSLLGTWSADFPVLPFIAGLLVGHLLWPRYFSSLLPRP